MSEPNVPPPPSYTPPPPPTGTMPPPPGGVSPNRTIMLVLAYLGPLALIPFVVEKNDPEVQWHAKHGLVLFAAEVVLIIALSVLHFVPFLGWMFTCVNCVLPLLIAIFHIFLIVQAVNGKRFLVPGISEYVNRF
jgi:fumarate reductase subunit D